MSEPRHGLRGPIAWMVGNRVTPNLLMLVLIVGGFAMSTRIKQEVFPEFSQDTVTVRVPYPGSSPEEVERGIVLVVEEAVRAIDGIEEITASASEGSGRVVIELESGADGQRVHQDIKQEIDRIRTFPDDAEEPQVTLDIRRREVLDIQVYGKVDEWSLREVAEQVRDRLLQAPGVSQVELDGARDYEVRVYVSQDALRTYGLTLGGIAAAIGRTAVEVPGGGIDTAAGEILLRVRERRDWAPEFADIPVVTTAEGTVVRLGEIAEVSDGFEETDRSATFDGKRSIGVEVYRVGDQTPIGVSDAVHAALDGIRADLPPGIDLAVNRDSSDIYRQRLELLMRNAGIGLGLVLLLLGLFLEVRLAFWVTLGIPTAFLGAFLFLPFLGVTINMISMFAFIVALGIVVDDAIVAGENIYEYRQRGMSFAEAAIRGARDVALPVSFSILTNMVAFLPLIFVPGILGKIWLVIPAVVTTVFAISWIEALFILPTHLAHGDTEPRNPLLLFLWKRQRTIGRGLTFFIEKAYAPVLRRIIRVRYVTVGAAIALLFVTVAFAISGRMGLILMPKVESDRAEVTALLPYGAPAARAEEVLERLVATARDTADGNGGKRLVDGIYGRINENEVRVSVYLTDPKTRPISTTEFTEKWRDGTGPIAGLQSLRFEFDRGGPGRGPSVTVELSHRDIDVLDRASEDLAATLLEFASVKDVDDGYTPGKPQLDLRLRPEGRSLGLTSAEVARQVRHAFYGAEALRQQRGRNEVKVRVRLPEGERVSEADLEGLLVRTPEGRDVPLTEVVDFDRGRAYTSISRRNGARTVTVSANVTPISETNRVLETVKSEILPSLVRDYPGLGFSFEGRQAEMRDALESLKTNFAIALMIIYVLLAIPFRSYGQPIVVMMAIPFGIVGAVCGHLIMGYSISIISMMGIVALSGVVVNDALVMIDYANRRRREGVGIFEAIHSAGVRRFRPILLTTLTTFGGLAPMIFETSRQARFMIPMALSLGYGIVFATVITLVLVPCLYMVFEDAKRAAMAATGWLTPPGEESEATGVE